MPLVVPIKNSLREGDLVVNLENGLVGIEDYGYARLFLCCIKHPMNKQETEYRVQNNYVSCRFRPSSYSGYRFVEHFEVAGTFSLNGTLCSQPFGRVSGSICYDDFYACRKFLRRLIKRHHKQLVDICHF